MLWNSKEAKTKSRGVKGGVGDEALSLPLPAVHPIVLSQNGQADESLHLGPKCSLPPVLQTHQSLSNTPC